MEYLDSGDLDTYLHRHPPLSEAEVKQVIGQILEGLCMMHDNQFAHRDLKPKNILLKSCPPNDWWVKIADFGISKRIEEDTYRSTTVKGTPGYIAPELYGFVKQGSPYAVDIWAVGEMVFRMLTKQPTFKQLGLLSTYTTSPETFPSGILRAVQSSTFAVEFTLSHMQPYPEDRITAANALLHQWIAQSPLSRQASVTSASHQDAQSSSTIESLTESFAAWDTITPQQAAQTSITMRAEDLEAIPHQISSKETVKAQPLDGEWEMLQKLEADARFVRAVAFSPDGKLVASASYDSTVQLWDPAGRTARDPFLRLLGRARPTVRRTLRVHSQAVGGVAFSPDGKLVASASYDHTVRLWDLATGEIRHILRGNSSRLYGVMFSPDGKLVASGSYDHTVRLWDPATGLLRHTLWHSSAVYGVAFSPDSTLVASGSNDRTVQLWDLATAAVCRTFKGHSSSVYGVAFSPDGKLIASTSRDLTVRLWDLATGAVRHTLKGHSESVLQVAFSPDGQLIASASNDHTVRLWDPATGVVRHTLSHCSWLEGVAFSPDGNLVASASDESVWLWGRAPPK